MKALNQKNKADSKRGGNYGFTKKIKDRVSKAYDKEFGRHTNNVAKHRDGSR